MTDHPIVPDFTPVTPDQIRAHWDSCPACHGPGFYSPSCPVGSDLWDRFRRQCQRDVERRHQSQAWDLIRAGWRFEVPGEDSDVLSWYWRRPPRRKGSRGRFYASTNQAWNAMRRETGEGETR